MPGLFYLDTSALAKLVVREPQSEALQAFLGQEIPILTSVVGVIELRRAARREDVPPDQVTRVVERVVLLGLDEDLREQAAVVGDSHLRTLDAIQLATALSIAGELEAFVCYDARLAGEASRAGLDVLAPSELSLGQPRASRGSSRTATGHGRRAPS